MHITLPEFLNDVMRFKEFFHHLIQENVSNDSFFAYHGGLMNRSSWTTTKGRWEYGPGLYLTNSFELAKKYAGGPRKVFLCKISLGNEISKVYIPVADVQYFLKLYGGTKRKQYLQDMERHIKNDAYPATILVNLAINYDMRASSAKALKEFLVEHGVDYAINRWSGETSVITLYNDSKLLSHKSISNVELDQYMLSVPG
jgi:hypothetical protein